MFRAPTSYAGDEMFLGQDRLDWVEDMLSHQATEAAYVIFLVAGITSQVRKCDKSNKAGSATLMQPERRSSASCRPRA